MAPDQAATLHSVAQVLGPEQRAVVVGADVGITDVHLDSRGVTPGSLYVAIKGANADGHEFIDRAVARGAVALAVEEPPRIDIPHLVVADTRQALGWLAAAVHGWPARRLGITGITGTNGKTTVAHMLMTLLATPPRTAAVIGTVSANLGNAVTSPRTTPESSDLQRMFRDLLTEGRVTDVALEVSSHAMVMGRVNGTEFDVVAFTNLSQDHLDFHGTMESYYRAKAALFQEAWAPHGVVWIDDDWGRRLAAESAIPVTTVGTDQAADVVVVYGAETPYRSTFNISIDGRKFEVESALAGRFNVANAAIALTCAHIRGTGLDDAVAKLAAMQPIPGRFNTLATGRDFWVVIDYAHTPDAIAGLIAESRGLTDGKVIALAGAGGDRDREKRPLMGSALATADLALITTDNPRSEDPLAIIEQIVAGVPTMQRVIVEPDRRLAIRRALATAAAGDVVLILGKGHEKGQEIAGRMLPFDDTAVVREELDRLTEVDV
jgi:UDP-N-acetylmuramoyl-L-alanyl-D-glutamate--2,6-diaminopimelate ligase